MITGFHRRASLQFGQSGSRPGWQPVRLAHSRLRWRLTARSGRPKDSARLHLSEGVQLFGLSKKKPQSVRLDAVDHPVLGRLEAANKVSGVLSGSVTIGSKPLEIAVVLDGEPLETALTFAAEAVLNFSDLDVRSRALVAAHCLASYNSDWRFGAMQQADGTWEKFEKPLLTEEQFASKLTPDELEITGASLIALTYSAGEMFWGHWVCVTSFDGLTLTDTDVELRG